MLPLASCSQLRKLVRPNSCRTHLLVVWGVLCAGVKAPVDFPSAQFITLYINFLVWSKKYMWLMFCQQCHPFLAPDDGNIWPRYASQIFTYHLFTSQICLYLHFEEMGTPIPWTELGKCCSGNHANFWIVVQHLVENLLNPWKHSPDLNLTPLAAFLRFLPSAATQVDPLGSSEDSQYFNQD